MDDAEYDEHIVQLEPGEQLFIFSDGVPEAMDSELEPLGDEAILEVLRSNTGSVASSVECLDIAAVDWCGDSRLKDDISIIAFERGTGKGS